MTTACASSIFFVRYIVAIPAMKNQLPLRINGVRVLDAEEVSDLAVIGALMHHEVGALSRFE